MTNNKGESQILFAKSQIPPLGFHQMYSQLSIDLFFNMVTQSSTDQIYVVLKVVHLSNAIDGRLLYETPSSAPSAHCDLLALGES